jgi:HSP20 family molecular chaperone IbpA
LSTSLDHLALRRPALRIGDETDRQSNIRSGTELVKEEKSMADEKLKMAADVCSYVNEDDHSIHLEICVPGVKKEAISLKVRDDSYSLFAPRNDFDYVSAAAFCCAVHSQKATASYENGMLKVKVPLKDPMEGAHDVRIQ